MYKLRYYAVCILLLSISQSITAQITGTVFRDYNGNGTRQNTTAFKEPIVAGVIVNAYNSSDALLASVTSTATGYSFTVLQVPNATAVRLEFIIPGSGACAVNSLYDFAGTGAHIGGGSVRFVTAGAAAVNINYGINNPVDYTADAAPFSSTNMVTVFQHTGNPLVAGTSASSISVYKFPYTNNGNTSPNGTPPPGATDIATNAQTGSLYGMAYSKDANRVFAAAYLRRHAGLGPANGSFNNSPGAIYIMNPSLTSATGASYFTSLDALGFATHNSTGTPAYGSGTSYLITGTGAGATITYLGAGNGVIGTNAQRGLPAAKATVSRDPAAFGMIGKVSLGDMEISDDGRFLFVVNLYDRKLYQLTLNSVTNPTAATVAGSWSLPNPPLRSTSGIPLAANTYTGLNNGTNFYDGGRGVQRPFALRYHRGRVYVGAVTTGENGGVSTQDNNTGDPEYTDLWSYVWEFNPTTSTFNTTPVLQTPLNFNRGTNADNQSESWKPWTSTFPAAWGNNFTQYQQPMFTSIAFDADGTMMLGFRDRFGDQSAYGEETMNNATVVDGQAMGDLYRAYYNPSTCAFEMEQNGKEGPNSPKAATAGVTNGNGPSNYTGAGGEFYFRDEVYNGNTATSIGTFHLNCTMGALAIIRGTDSIATTSMDPLRAWSGGTSWFSNISGDNGRDYEMYAGLNAGNFPNSLVGDPGKSNGLGDLELLGTLSPIEIGDRVWNDANGDGIQTAGEAGIANVILELVDAAGNPVDSDPITPGVQATFVTTDANGNWFITSASGTDVLGINYGVALLPNTQYTVRLATSGTGNDWDPTLNGGIGGPRVGGDLVGLQLSRTNKIGNGQAGLSDNDASMVNAIPQAAFTTGAYGQTNTNIDFGFKPFASLGDRVWRDDNKDGVQDANEPGVAGITVTLKDNLGVVVTTTVTDAYGYYMFNRLAAGTYTITVTLPVNYTFTTQTNTVDNTAGTAPIATGSDVNATTGQSYNVVLSAGENEVNIDAGLIYNTPVAPATVGNRVFFDTNGDNLQTAGEPGVSGVTVSLLNNSGVVIATTITDANGNYTFTNVAAGTYSVRFTLPPGNVFVTADQGTGGAGTGGVGESDLDSDAGVNGVTGTFTVAAGQQIVNVDAGVRLQANTVCSIGDRVWYDNNRDGDQDAGEPGIPNVTVNLYRPGIGPDGIAGNADDNTAVATTTTDAYGYYIFNNRVAGTYSVSFAPVAGLVRTARFATGGASPTAAYDSDPNPVDGYTSPFSVAAGNKNLSIDCGYYSSQPAANVGAIGDRVWNDLNGNGVQDAGEPGVPGVTVTLYNSSGTAVATTYTDANGNYLFPNLTPGTYTVGFSNLPLNFAFTGQGLGGNTATDSDVNPGTGRTASIVVTGGVTNTSVDAGIRQSVPSGLGTIGDRVWYDINGNGLQDVDGNGNPTELGVAGVTVTLLDAGVDGIVGNGDDGASRTTTTDALGEYIFGGLPAGNYVVQWSALPAGFTATTAKVGTNDDINSDGGAIGTGGAPAGASRTAVYNLASGEDNLSVDLGLIAPANTNSIGDYVWSDNGGGTPANAGNGIQDTNEPGVAGIKVTLYNSGGTAIANTVTDAYGHYQFVGLADGTYSVGFSNLPVGFDFTPKDAVGSTTANGSDADRASGRTGTVVLGSANRNDRSLDAGIITTRAGLGNFVWNDLNNDGIQTAGEPGVSGVTVSLYFDADNNGSISGAEATNPVASAITDAKGAYYFANLLPGNYQVGFSTIPSGMIFTQQNTPGDNQNNTNSDANPGTGLTSLINLTATEVDLTIDAGLTVPRPATIGNFVWADLNSNGLQDAGEPGVSGVLVTLYNSSNVAIGSAITNGDGFWQITNVPPGTGYYVIFSANIQNFNGGGANPGWTAQNNGTGGTQSLDSGTESDLDSDVTPTGVNAGRTAAFNIVAGNTFNNIDAGIINLASSAVLPIKLESFTAAPQNGNVILKWVVSEEINVAKYEIEFSVDGRSFNSIGAVTATNSRNYSLLHTAPVSGINYYRLKTSDKDGQISFSEIRRVNFGRLGETVSVYPVPAKDNINITLGTSMINKAADIQILAIDGMLLQRFSTGAANQTETINVSKLASGKYIVRIVSGETIINKTIEVIR